MLFVNDYTNITAAIATLTPTGWLLRANLYDGNRLALRLVGIVIWKYVLEQQ